MGRPYQAGEAVKSRAMRNKRPALSSESSILDLPTAKLLRRVEMLEARRMRELTAKKVRATIARGGIRVEVNGHLALTSIRIDPELLRRVQPPELEDLVLEVINRARQKMIGELEAEWGLAVRLPNLFPHGSEPY
jgi:DNA-binding protein YbaB